MPCPRTRLRTWSREKGSAVPSRVSLLILHTQAESGAHSRDSSPFSRRRPFIYFNCHIPSSQPRVHRVTQLRTDGVHCRESAGKGPVFLKVVPVHCRESAGKGPVFLKVVPVTGSAILQVTMDQLMCASLFSQPLLV